MLCTCIDCHCLSDFHEGRPVARVQMIKRRRRRRGLCLMGLCFLGTAGAFFFQPSRPRPSMDPKWIGTGFLSASDLLESSTTAHTIDPKVRT
jgi:hypothetical protein